MKKPAIIAVGLLLLITGCGDSRDPMPQTPATPPPPPPPEQQSVSYELSVINLTNAQPLSPLAVILHGRGFSSFSAGESAGEELEMLAESGDGTALLNLADADSNVLSTASGAGVIMSGMSETLTISASGDAPLDLRLTVLTMAVNTNDAFTGGNSIDLNNLANGEQMSWLSIAYDAGTEANSEAVTDIPGPAAGGEGFNAARDDRVDMVTVHAGVVTSEDGLMGSVLNGQHRFLNPVAKFTVLRTE